MTETIFTFLNGVGFAHPLHPALTHIPMGMVIGAVVFRMASFLPKMKHLARTGYHCVILGLLGIPPTVFAGYLDWQHTYGGEWEFLIILKMILAGILTIHGGPVYSELASWPVQIHIYPYFPELVHLPRQL